MLEPNDILVLYTDGITEAMSPEGELFGTNRLIETIDLNQKKSAQQLLDIVLQDIRNHADGAAQSDDITMMIIKKEAA